MKTLFDDKQILLGVTGSIASYKTAELASRLSQLRTKVDVVLTQAAQQFITPLTLQSVAGSKAYTDSDLWGDEGHVLHINLAKKADMLVVAPATANTISKLAYGLADNLLTITVLAAGCPIIIAPAMDGRMYSHPATQVNLETLRQRGVKVVGPAEGHLASGIVGKGRMLEPLEILGHIRQELSRGGPLKDRKIIVTAGGTQEAIDPVRYITNRSSGKQGYALAQAALDLGAQVTLISAQTCMKPPIGADCINVRSALEMHDAVSAEILDADALVMAAAVADFAPTQPTNEKIKKEHGVPVIKLTPTVDILQMIADSKSSTSIPFVTVGFAAESSGLLENAQRKLREKKLDMIVANDITQPDAGFEVDTNRVTIIHADGQLEEFQLMSKDQVAQIVMERVTKFILERNDNR